MKMRPNIVEYSSTRKNIEEKETILGQFLKWSKIPCSIDDNIWYLHCIVVDDYGVLLADNVGWDYYERYCDCEYATF